LVGYGFSRYYPDHIADIEHNKKGAGRVTGIDLGTAVIDNEWKKETGETTAVVTVGGAGSQSVEACAPAWQTGVVTYLPGDEVSYDGINYQAVQEHTPQGDPGWAPPNTPALWAPLSPCV